MELSMKEQDQLVIFSKLRDREITQTVAAKALSFSIRWVRKKLKQFIQLGSSGLVHQGRGKPSPKA